MNRLCCSSASKAIVVFATMLSSACHAQFSMPSFPIPLPNPGNDIDTITGNGKYKIKVKNATNRPIWVAVHRLGHEDYERWWKTQGWWRLSPGEKAYIVDTKNRYVYLHAHNDRGATWGNGIRKHVVNRRFKILHAQGNAVIPKDAYLAQFSKVDLGKRFGEFTYTFRQ